MTGKATWELSEVHSPDSAQPVPVIVVRDLPLLPDANRLQRLSIYLPVNEETLPLVGTAPSRLPPRNRDQHYHVHIHGGAWRDPLTDARSIEPAVGLIFADPTAPIAAVASLDYTLAQFPTHPVAPYDATKDGHTDPAREAVHPRQVADIYAGLRLLKTIGMTDGSYILSGHSCGASLAFQAALAPPAHYDLADTSEPPVAAAVIGINGLYDLPGLVLGLGPSHEINSHDYRMMLTNAFGPDDRVWAVASPARFDSTAIAGRVRAGRAPPLVWLAQSPDDQLVPMNQLERFAANLEQVDGLTVEIGECTGKHAEPWQTGTTIRQSILSVTQMLAELERSVARHPGIQVSGLNL